MCCRIKNRSADHSDATVSWHGKNSRGEGSASCSGHLFFQRNNRRLPLDRRRGGPQGRYGHCVEETVLQLLGIELRLTGLVIKCTGIGYGMVVVE